MSKSKAKGTLFENEVRDDLSEDFYLLSEDFYRIEDRSACTGHKMRVYRCGERVGHPGDVEFSIVPYWDSQDFDGTECYGPYYVECKRRAKAWKELYSWLDNPQRPLRRGQKKQTDPRPPNDFLALRADRQRTLIVMDMDQFKSLLAGHLPKPRRSE